MNGAWPITSQCRRCRRSQFPGARPDATIRVPAVQAKNTRSAAVSTDPSIWITLTNLLDRRKEQWRREHHRHVIEADDGTSPSRLRMLPRLRHPLELAA